MTLILIYCIWFTRKILYHNTVIMFIMSISELHKAFHSRFWKLVSDNKTFSGHDLIGILPQLIRRYCYSVHHDSEFYTQQIFLYFSIYQKKSRYRSSFFKRILTLRLILWELRYSPVCQSLVSEWQACMWRAWSGKGMLLREELSQAWSAGLPVTSFFFPKRKKLYFRVTCTMIKLSLICIPMYRWIAQKPSL